MSSDTEITDNEGHLVKMPDDQLAAGQTLSAEGVSSVSVLLSAKQQAIALQQEMPFAIVSGESMTQMPLDLYIPPDALEVFLDAFEGPLDLLLYLIKKQNLDILSINVFEITTQYMEYVELMHSLNLELAADYLVMASMLAEIKSRILLPRQSDNEDEEDDPRAELIRRLQEYERFKKLAEDIDELPRVGRDVYTLPLSKPEEESRQIYPDVDFKELLLSFKLVVDRSNMFENHQVSREVLSTRERMAQVLEQLKKKAFVPFVTLFHAEEGKLGVVVTFIAIMELCKEGLIDLVQNETYGPIHVKAKSE